VNPRADALTNKQKKEIARTGCEQRFRNGGKQIPPTRNPSNRGFARAALLRSGSFRFRIKELIVYAIQRTY
jgi:hypothetical protein